MAAKAIMRPQEDYWSYRTDGLPIEPPPDISHIGWSSLSPGMQREVWRHYRASLDKRREYLDQKSETQLAARQRI